VGGTFPIIPLRRGGGSLWEGGGRAPGGNWEMRSSAKRERGGNRVVIALGEKGGRGKRKLSSFLSPREKETPEGVVSHLKRRKEDVGVGFRIP